MKCLNCGAEYQKGKFCSICGMRLVAEQKEVFEKGYIHKTECDLYERELRKKKKIEEIGDGLAGILWLILCGIVVVNNWGYRETREIVIICILIIVVIKAIYNAIAASIGFYNADKNLEKYIQLKKEVGNVEAIKIMEQTVNTKEGYAMLNAGIKGSFMFVKGIFGFVITIVGVILAISLC